jgi:hypothetical protein
MNTFEMLEKYSKSATIVIHHFTEQFNKSLETSDIDPEFKEFAKTQVLDAETVAAFIDATPRSVFDVFDANGIYINTTSSSDGSFTYSIMDNLASFGSTDTFKTRIEAEKLAIEEAFKLLNDK